VGEGQEEGKAGALVRSPAENCEALRPSWTGAFAPVVPPSCSPSSEGETQSGTFWHGQTRDTIDGRGDAPTRAEPSAPESLLRREKDRKRGAGRPVRWFGVLPRTARRCARRGPGRSRRLSLPLVIPPLRERRGPARSAAGRAEMLSTRGAIRQPEQKPPPPRPFSGGRRTGRGDGGSAHRV
jgi:hypothetical protein